MRSEVSRETTADVFLQPVLMRHNTCVYPGRGKNSCASNRTARWIAPTQRGTTGLSTTHPRTPGNNTTLHYYYCIALRHSALENNVANVTIPEIFLRTTGANPPRGSCGVMATHVPGLHAGRQMQRRIVARRTSVERTCSAILTAVLHVRQRSSRRDVRSLKSLAMGEDGLFGTSRGCELTPKR